MAQHVQALRSGVSVAAPPGRGYPAAALALVLAGVCFALHPAIRPFSDETTLRGAQAFASVSWQVAHALAMVAFIRLTLGLWGLYALLSSRRLAAGRGVFGTPPGVDGDLDGGLGCRPPRRGHRHPPAVLPWPHDRRAIAVRCGRAARPYQAVAVGMGVVRHHKATMSSGRTNLAR